MPPCTCNDVAAKQTHTPSRNPPAHTATRRNGKRADQLSAGVRLSNLPTTGSGNRLQDCPDRLGRSARLRLLLPRSSCHKFGEQWVREPPLLRDRVEALAERRDSTDLDEGAGGQFVADYDPGRSGEHTSELQSQMRTQ